MDWSIADTRELAELALMVVHLDRLAERYRPASSIGDRIGSAIGYALLAVVLLLVGGAAVWLVRLIWSAALN